MLPKKRRIPRGDFESLFNKGKRYISPHLILYVSKHSLLKESDGSRFSFSVSKKVCKSAVGRNKLRRQGYSVINDNLNLIKSGFFCLFSFKKDSTIMRFGVLRDEILGLLSDSLVIE